MSASRGSVPLERLDPYTWRIPQTYRKGMRVPGIVYADDALVKGIRLDRTLHQCANVAQLPGIYKCAITLPDGHEGYGFPIGGVAATDYEAGVLSPGGVGYDINCGVRLLTTTLAEADLRPHIPELTDVLFKNIPSGLGSSRDKFRLSPHQLARLVAEGAPWVIRQGLGWPEDAAHCEEEGCMTAANPEAVSPTATKRGLAQVGTLGSGNHFLEVDRVDAIYDVPTAKAFGIHREGQVTVQIHTGSRGFGHQVCSDALRTMERAVQKYGIALPDRELACAPGHSAEAQTYYQAMACAVNYAFANRQAITHWVRESFAQVLRKPAETFGLEVVYDVAHNIAKIEEHEVEGQRRKVWVHRKGATRSLGPGRREVPAAYRALGQPVLIPGTMGSSSWVMVGTAKALEASFGSTAHGAGRVLSRSAAIRRYRGNDIQEQLRRRGIVAKAASQEVLAEEAPGAYKDVDRVAEVSHQLGIATKVARLLPMAVIKG